MFASFKFWLIVLAVLTAYLCVSVWFRGRAMARSDAAKLRAIEGEYPPRAFDSSAIAPAIRRLRLTHPASAQRRWLPGYYRSGLIADARRLISGLAFFTRKNPDHELHKPMPDFCRSGRVGRVE